jgi:hypothetical protein
MKKIILITLVLLSTVTCAEEKGFLDKQTIGSIIELSDWSSNKDMFSQCCKVCTKGCPCGNTCISCSKDCHVGPGCACREPMELGNQANQPLELTDCKIL